MKFHAEDSMDRRARMAVVGRVRAVVESGGSGIMGQVVRSDGHLGWAAITFPGPQAAAVVELLRAHPADDVAGPPRNLPAGEVVVPPARLPVGNGDVFATGWLSLPATWSAGRWAVSGMSDGDASHVNLAVTY